MYGIIELSKGTRTTEQGRRKRFTFERREVTYLRNPFSMEIQTEVTFMTDFEILSIMLMYIGVIVGILIEYIKK